MAIKYYRNMSTLSQYNVQFGIKTFFNKEREFISSTNDSLSAFIGSFYTSTSANSLILTLTDVIGNVYNNVSCPTQSMMVANISDVITKIFDDDDDYLSGYMPDYEIPTPHLKIIVEAWRDFLVSRGK